MQRLTARSAQSHAVPSEFNLDFAWDMSKSEWAGLQRVFDRLAAYEDIGLTPEEIKDNMEMFHSYRHICAGMEPDLLRDLTKMVYGIILDRLRELMDVRNMGKRAVSEVLAWLSQSVVFVDPEVDGLMGQLGVFKISVLSDVRNE